MAEDLKRRHGLGAEMLRQAIESLEDIAIEQNSPELTAMVGMMNRGRVAGAVPLFRSIAQTYEEAEGCEPGLQAQALRNLAAVQLWDNPEAAIISLRRACEIAPKDAGALVFLATLLFEAQAHDEALPLLQKLVKLKQTGENRRWQGIGSQLLGILAHVGGKLDEAMEYYENAIRVFRQVEDEQRLAECMGNLGLIYRRKKDYDAAASLFQDALELWRGYDRPSETTRTLGYLASVFFILGEYDDAIELFAERAQINEAEGEQREMAADHANMGQCFSKKGNAKSACNHWREAFHLYEELGQQAEAGSLSALLQAHSDRQQPAA